MRLAVVSPFVDRRHGTERALAELLERLARDFHCEIHLYSQRVEHLSLKRSAAPIAKETGGIIWHKVPKIPGPHLLQFLFWLFLNASCRAWDRAIHKLRFDLVLSPGINCLDADLVVVHVLFHRLRELARASNASDRPGLLRRFHRRAYYSLLTWLEHRIYTDPKVSIVAVSERTAALVSDYFHRKDVRVIPNGVNTAHFSPARRLALRAEARARRKFPESDFVLLLIGNDWRNKGLATILDAMAACREIPLRLLVVGQDPAASSFREAAERLGLSSKCRWETALTDAIDLFAAADVYVSPSLEDSFGMPVLEAMACGLSVVTSVFAGVSQIVTDDVNGFVLRDPNDVATLARHLRNLQGQASLRLRMGESATRTAQDYSWDRNASAIWEVLKGCASRSDRAFL